MGPFSNPALQYYAIASSVLALHLIALALWTGRVRVQKKQYTNSEDAKLNKAEHTEIEHPDVRRVIKAHTNALENAIPFFVVGALYVASGATKTGALAYFGTFVAMRILHTFFYLGGKQPFRTLSFGIGALAVIGMAIGVIRAAIA
jgi:microsomal prostaglandin-E synthase 1